MGVRLKSLSCHLSLPTMDCLNDKSNHLMNVSAQQGDKQRRVKGEKFRRYEGGNRRGELEERTAFFFSIELCQAVRGQTTIITLFLCLSVL